MAQSKLKEFIKSPKKSLFYISLPIIAAAIVETLYNIVDTIFVGRLGAKALAAMTFSWPFFFILVAISLGINSGISSRISRFIGEKNKKQAENTALHGLLIALIASVFVIITGLLSLKFFLSLSGATGEILTMAHTYMFIILLGTIFMFLSYAANSIFISQGDTKTAMKIDIYSLIINIILAPIFIFWFHLGIAGAALATSCSVLFAFFQSIYYLKRKSYLQLNFKCFKFSKKIMKEIISVGFPSTLMIMIISFYVIFLNRAMAHFSIENVAAFGIISRLESVSTLPIYGLSIGTMTLAGMFFGAKKYKKLREISWFATKVGIAVSSLIGIIFFVFPKYLLMIFTNDKAVIDAAIPLLKLDVFTFPTMAVMMILSRVLQSMGHGMPGLIINLVRVFAIAIPLSYLFVFILDFGYLSIAVAMIISGVISALMGMWWLNWYFGKLKTG